MGRPKHFWSGDRHRLPQLGKKQVARQLAGCDMDIHGWIRMSARNGRQGNGFNDRCFLKGVISHLNCITPLAGFTYEVLRFFTKAVKFR
jgi:hypothetical protein